MNDQNWKTIIEPQNRRINLNFKEIWEYRDLIKLFVKRDFTAKYKQTVLGPAWAVIQPVLTTVVFSIVFGNLADLTTMDILNSDVQIPSFLFYMIGTIVWTYFSTTVTSTSNTFIGNAAIMGKVYYPRMVTPISTAFSNSIPFFIQIVLYIAIMLICVLFGVADLRITRYIVLFPLLVVQMMMLSMGVGIIISSLTTKYRDLAMLVGFGLQLWEYLSPIPYGLSLIPQSILPLYMLNPVTPIILMMRIVFTGEGYLNWMYYLISMLMSILIFTIGMIQFNKIERTFMDTV